MWNGPRQILARRTCLRHEPSDHAQAVKEGPRELFQFDWPALTPFVMCCVHRSLVVSTDSEICDSSGRAPETTQNSRGSSSGPSAGANPGRSMRSKGMGQRIPECNKCPAPGGRAALDVLQFIPQALPAAFDRLRVVTLERE